MLQPTKRKPLDLSGANEILEERKPLDLSGAESILKKKESSKSTIPTENSDSVPIDGSLATQRKKQKSSGFPEIDMNNVAPGNGVQPSVSKPEKKYEEGTMAWNHRKMIENNPDYVNNYKKLKDIQKVDDAKKQKIIKDTEEEFNGSGIWNNIKSLGKKAINAISEPTVAGLSSLGSVFSSEDSDEYVKNAVQKSKIEIDPFAEEKQQAKNEYKEAVKTANLNKTPIPKYNPEEIKNRALQIKIDNRIKSESDTQLKDYLKKDEETGSKDKTKFITFEAGKYSTLKDRDKELLQKQNIERNVALGLKGELEDLQKNIAKNGLNENNRSEYLDKYQKYQDVVSEAIKTHEEYANNRKDLGDSSENLDVFKRDYGSLKSFLGNIDATVTDLSAGGLGAIDYALESTKRITGFNPKEQNIIRGASEDLKSDADKIRSEIMKPISVDNINNWSDFGDWFFQTAVAQQVPIYGLLATGNVGVGAIGGTSLGNKFEDMQAKIKSGEEDYSTAELMLNPIGYGVAETASAMVDRMLLKNAGRVIASASQPERQMIAQGFAKRVLDATKNVTGSMAKGAVYEGIDEGLTQGFENLIDGKPFLDNIKDPIVAGAVMGAVIPLGGQIIAQATKPFSTDTQIQNSASEITRLRQELNNPELSSTARLAIQEDLAKQQSKLRSSVGKVIGDVESLSEQQFEEIIRSETTMANIKEKAIDIRTDDTIDDSMKNQLLGNLREEFDATNQRRLDLLERGYNVILERLPSEEVIDLKNKAQRELIQEKNPDGTSSITINDEEISKRAIQIYNKNQKESDNSPETKPFPFEIIKPINNIPEIDIRVEKGGVFLGDFLNDYDFLAEGSEHTVYRSKDGKTVIKIGEPHNSDETYTQRVNDALEINNLIGDGSLSVIGNYRSPNGTLNPIYQQNFIEGETATNEQVSKSLTEKGFVKVDDNTFVINNNGIVKEISDISDNFIVGKDGNIVAVDASIRDISMTSLSKEIQEQLTNPNIKNDLVQINKEIFGLDDIQSEANAVVMDKIIETMAERSGISKEEMFNKILFQKGDSEISKNLSKKGDALFQIAGVNGNLPRPVRVHLNMAKILEKEGMSVSEIRYRTGWERGADNKWTYELDSSKASLKNDISKSKKLEDILDFTELYEYYPDFKDIDISVDTGVSYNGSANTSKNKISLNSKLLSNTEKVLSTILHELQHFIQKKEGFPRGGNSKSIRKILEKAIDKKPAYKENLLKIKEFLFGENKNKKKIDPKLSDFVNNVLKKSDFELYKSLSGEVQARNVEKRQGLSQSERKKTLIRNTEDIPRENHIMLFQDNQGAMLSEDSGFIIYALENPNVSTPLHEMAHVYEHYMTDSERQIVLDDVGHKEWSRDTSEYFARSFEKYLSDGKAPNKEMKELFENFKKWLTEIYNGIINSDIDITISPKMKKVFDMMLGEKNTKTNETVSESNTTSDGSNGIGNKPMDEVRVAEQENIVEEPVSETVKPRTSEAETKVDEEEKSALKNADIAKKRKELGLEEREKVTRKKNDELVDSASKKIKEGYDTEELIDDILDSNSNRTLTDEEVVILKQYQLAKENRLVEIGEEIVNATNEGKSNSKLNKLIEEREQLVNDIDKAYRAGEQSGTITARALQARRLAMMQDYSLANMLIQKIKAIGDQKLSPEQIQEVSDEYAKIKKLREELEQKILNLEKEKADLKAGTNIEKLAREERKNKRKAKTEEIDSDIKSTMENLRKKLREQAGRMSSNAIPIEIIPEIAKLAQLYVKKGIVKLDDIVDEIHSALKDVSNLSKEDIKEIIGDYNYELESDNENRLARLKKRTKEKIEELREKLGKQDFEKKQNTPVQLDEEAKKLKDELRQAKFDWDKALEKDILARRQAYEKIRDGIAEVLNLPRSVMASIDFSAPLRQGLVLTVSHPVTASKAFVEMFKQAVSQKRFDRWLEDLKETPQYEVMKDSGLYIADNHSAKLSAKEEQFMSNLANKIPIIGKGFEAKVGGKKVKLGGLDLIGGSERAYVSYLNKLRTDIFAKTADAFEKEGYTVQNKPELYRALGKYINSATGRGDLGGLNESAGLLNSLFFSPRLIASRINLLTNWANPIWLINTPAKVKQMYALDMFKLVSVGVTLLTLASLGGADVEDDPRSSDFGKIRSGNQRWDMWGGFQQFVRFFSQFYKNQRKTASGQIKNLGEGFNSDTRADLFWNMVRSKMAPVPGTAWNLMDGKNMVGEEYTLKDVPKSFLPLFASDLYKAIERDGAAKGIIETGIPAVFGVGVQNYETKPSNSGGKYDRERGPKPPSAPKP